MIMTTIMVVIPNYDGSDNGNDRRDGDIGNNAEPYNYENNNCYNNNNNCNDYCNCDSSSSRQSLN